MPLRVSCVCPSCSHEFYTEIWQVLDLGEAPGLREQLLKGEINRPFCPHCGSTFVADSEFLIHDPTCKRVIFFVPAPSGQADPVSIQLLRNTLSVAFPRRKRYFKRPVVVTGWHDLMLLLAEGTDGEYPIVDEEMLTESFSYFLSGDTWERKKAALMAHPELLGDEASALLDSWIDRTRQENEAHMEEVFTLARLVLHRCRTIGVEDAFAEFMEAAPVTTAADGRLVVELPEQTGERLDTMRLEELAALEEAARRDPARVPELIAMCERALDWPEVAQDPQLQAAVWLDLGAAYRHLRGGNAVQSLRRAIEYLTSALTVYTPEAAPDSYATVQNQLGLAYLELPTYDQSENLERAITCFQGALRFRSPERAPLDYAETQNNLGMALTRLENVDRTASLLQGVSHFREALRLYTVGDTPEEYAKTCNNLGTAYYDLRDVDPAYLPLAIETYQRALGVWTEDSPQSWLRASVLMNLGKAYADLPDRHPEDALGQAISCYEAALVLLDGEQDRREVSLVYEGLGDAYRAMPGANRAEWLDRAERTYYDALTYLSPSTFPADMRRVALALGDLHLEQRAWDEAVMIYREAEVANDTLYRIAATELSRRRELSHAAGLFNNSAYALAREGRLTDAAVQLEAGRTQILTEVLARTQASLEQVDPEDRSAFEEASDRVRALEVEARSPERPFAAISVELRDARQELAGVVSRIRGYHPQFMPRRLRFEAISAAHTRPLVYLITNSVGSLALIVPPGAGSLGVEHSVWLDAFSTGDLEGLLVSKDAGGEVTGGYLVGQVGGDPAILQAALDGAWPVLHERLVGPVASRLAELGYRQATFIACGRLSLLPLHAVAIEGLTVSYAQSARALRAAGDRVAVRARQFPILLAVGGPLPSTRPLAFAGAEVEEIRSRFQTGAGRLLRGSKATKAEVLNQLSGATHLHFACHGTFSVDEPLDSALYLSGDDLLTLRDLLDGGLDLSAARLAVLSACQTGITDFLRVPDEAVGFPAGFLQAGVPGVVSTLWPVNDLSTALLMGEFYRRHLEEAQNPAQALRRTQRWLRDATAGETKLAEHFERRYQDSGRRDAAALRSMRTFRANPEVKPFAHPYYWAGFVFSGA
jgi:CHAT domain-containing protein/tetratricopeptide (TPR) repeat protein